MIETKNIITFYHCTQFSTKKLWSHVFEIQKIISANNQIYTSVQYETIFTKSNPNNIFKNKLSATFYKSDI